VIAELMLCAAALTRPATPTIDYRLLPLRAGVVELTLRNDSARFWTAVGPTASVGYYAEFADGGGRPLRLGHPIEQDFPLHPSRWFSLSPRCRVTQEFDLSSILRDSRVRRFYMRIVYSTKPILVMELPETKPLFHGPAATPWYEIARRGDRYETTGRRLTKKVPSRLFGEAQDGPERRS